MGLYGPGKGRFLERQLKFKYLEVFSGGHEAAGRERSPPLKAAGCLEFWVTS